MTDVNETTYATRLSDMLLLVRHSFILCVFDVRRLAVLVALNRIFVLLTRAQNAIKTLELLQKGFRSCNLQSLQCVYSDKTWKHCWSQKSSEI